MKDLGIFHFAMKHTEYFDMIGLFKAVDENVVRSRDRKLSCVLDAPLSSEKRLFRKSVFDGENSGEDAVRTLLASRSDPFVNGG